MSTVPPSAPPPPPPPYVPPPTMTPPQPGPGQPPPAKSGCGKIACIGCSILTVLAGIAVFCLVFFVFRVIKSSDVYTEAANRATHDPRVIAVLGEPIETGFWVSGSVKIDNDHGTANINFPISGPKGKAKVHAEATHDGHAWHYAVLRVQPSDGPAIDLSESETPPATETVPDTTTETSTETTTESSTSSQ